MSGLKDQTFPLRYCFFFNILKTVCDQNNENKCKIIQWCSSVNENLEVVRIQVAKETKLIKQWLKIKRNLM